MNTEKSISEERVVCVSAGQYEIGCHSIPNASPVHSRRVDEFWIDREPLSFAHFEVFVAGAGYYQQDLWKDSKATGVDFLTHYSVDRRCADLRKHAEKIIGQLNVVNPTSREIPLVGLTWMEAAAVCRFFKARLPFEYEWEVAMDSSSKVGTQMLPGLSQSDLRVSRWGCVIASGQLQEWTASPFYPKYWRSDNGRQGKFWTIRHPLGTSLRGADYEDLYFDHRFRRSANPTEVSSFRSFRRVWHEKPSKSQWSADFMVAGA